MKLKDELHEAEILKLKQNFEKEKTDLRDVIRGLKEELRLESEKSSFLD